MSAEGDQWEDIQNLDGFTVSWLDNIRDEIRETVDYTSEMASEKFLGDEGYKKLYVIGIK